VCRAISISADAATCARPAVGQSGKFLAAVDAPVGDIQVDSDRHSSQRCRKRRGSSVIIRCITAASPVASRCAAAIRRTAPAAVELSSGVGVICFLAASTPWRPSPVRSPPCHLRRIIASWRVLLYISARTVLASRSMLLEVQAPIAIYAAAFSDRGFESEGL
jgi:hypothetical protein